MFGYIRVSADDLKVRDFRYYRAVYCGLCRSMAREISPLFALTLRFDFVLLILVRMSLTGERGAIEKKRCIIHPLHRHPSMADNEELRYAARCAAVLTDDVVADHIQDEKGLKRTGYRVLRPLTRRWSNKAKKKGLPAGLVESVSEQLEAQACLERKKEPVPDAAAEPFGRLLSLLFSAGLNGENARIAGEIGKHVGRFIYLTDALDDAEEDEKDGKYNPFVLAAEEEKKPLSTWLSEQKDSILTALQMEGVSSMRALELSENQEKTPARACAENIFVCGMHGDSVLHMTRKERKAEKRTMRKRIHDGSV